MVLQKEHLQKMLSSYQHLGSTAWSSISTSYARASIHDIPGLVRWFLLDVPVAPVLLCFHVLFVAAELHKPGGGKHYWIKSLALTTFAAYGGATISCILSGATPAMFTTASNYMLGYVFAAWWVVHTVPTLRWFLTMRPVRAVLAFGAKAAKARSLFAFMDNFVVRFPGAAAGAVVLGGLAGSGGALVIAFERKLRLGPTARSALSRPGWGFKSPYIAAALYYVLTDPDGVLRSMSIPLRSVVPRDDARFAISLALASQAFVEALYGRNFNPLSVIEYVLFSLARLDRSEARVRRADAGSAVSAKPLATVARPLTRNHSKKKSRVTENIKYKNSRNRRQG